MDTASYPFANLQKTYEYFHAPSCEIVIGSLKLLSHEVDIVELEVELSSDGTAGGCRFTVQDGFDYAGTKWDSKLVSALKVGEKLKVSMGYLKRKEIFYGYIDDITFEYAMETGPMIHVSGMDGMGYLMGVRSRVFAGQKKVGDLVNQLLGDCVSAGVAKSKKVGASIQDLTVQRIKDGEDSFTFLNTLAKQLGVNFFCVDGELIFDKVTTAKSDITSLEYGKGLLSFQKRISLANQPGKVIVRGRDINNAPISGEATSTTLPGNGKSASQTASKILKKAVYEEENPLVQTAEECKKLAQNRFDDLAQNFVMGEALSVGIPELIPGRYIELKGMDKSTSGSYFMRRVTHTFDGQEYVTKIDVRGAKSN